MSDAQQEAEANYFAICLLMPRELVVAEVRAMGGVDLVDDEQVGKLARKFNVSIALMATRLAQILAEMGR